MTTIDTVIITLEARRNEALRYWRERENAANHGIEYAASRLKGAQMRVRKPCAQWGQYRPMLSHHKGCCQPLTTVRT